MPEQPNILLIITDQWRGDCLSIAGHPVVHTPYLDTLALRGARFSQAYSACPTCIAARAALFTGMNQESHGRVGHLDGVPWNYPVTLAGEFTRFDQQFEMSLRPESRARYEREGGSELLELLTLQAQTSYQLHRNGRRRELEEKSLLLLAPMTIDLLVILLVSVWPAVRTLIH